MKPELSENALRILAMRYLKKDRDGAVIETPEGMFRRVALHVARAEKTFGTRGNVEETAEDFYGMLSSLEFLPNSPTLMNAGRELGQLAACFVLPVEDSLESIFDAVKNTAIIHQSGGGTGFSFSHLRPKNDMVLSTSGVASGPVSFMEVFNKATDIIKQGGTRRGANMGVLRIDHPDIEEFIAVKRDPLLLGSFNLSVGVTDAFMATVREDLDFPLVSPRSGAPVRTVRARDLFDHMVRCAWENGEPGVLFLDEINRHNPTPHLGSIETTNPCGEQPLLAYEACTLGSVNLSRMVRVRRGREELDWDRLGRTTALAVRFLDDVVEINRYPLPQIRRLSRGNRKIGLGVMGFAHLIIRLGVPYGSPEAVELAGRLMRFIQEHGHEASRELARTRGSFANFPGSVYDRTGEAPMRNATVTTIAPTGTLSVIAGCSSGIEPLYALYTTRIIPGGIGVGEMDRLFTAVAQARGVLDARLMESVRKTGFIPDDSPVPQDLKDLFAPAFRIPPVRHVAIQAAFQAHTDNAVSKTINFSREASPDDVRESFLLAHELKCKGITIYRDGSRPGQTLTCGLTGAC
ncbi:MAG TPA: adenosylcobalamin-dependent ribonucleoside-diphosphate reductase [Deltaproteobacteria bacterium]|nr:MAG: Ribonucleoside-diphosphate reductase NrdZ [Deltaproteobacteria bacterium ADurb.Bin072]HNQ84274.1 adenosylcobalamin-dependent ribonucleoside-diphosphate reductase [Deltaproteobacteria bacterium]HOA44974.1 adenosylcobalamin-dependent ribonucleoside-diphosphate reductase [Deltaproteobacteria bacterium]HOG83606.1 adenosylcobalamin-dependent ribonucleoside-diphosphate reductase [Deltaproteobacteria bacterium]HOY74813.1 adenosylcobalamin-dependent ribonucleoside-diphosphate reductase [Deltapr